MHQTSSQPLNQAQYEPVRLVRGREDVRERWARHLSDQSQMTSQACAIDKHPEDPIFEKVDLGIVWSCAGNRSQADRGYETAKGRRIRRR